MCPWFLNLYPQLRLLNSRLIFIYLVDVTTYAVFFKLLKYFFLLLISIAILVIFFECSRIPFDYKLNADRNHGSIILWWYWSEFFFSSFEISFKSCFRSPNFVLFYILKYFYYKKFSFFLGLKEIIGIIMVRLKVYIASSNEKTFHCFIVNLFMRFMQLFVCVFFFFYFLWQLL